MYQITFKCFVKSPVKSVIKNRYIYTEDLYKALKYLHRYTASKQCFDVTLSICKEVENYTK